MNQNDRLIILEEIANCLRNFTDVKITEDTLKQVRNTIYKKLWELQCRGITTTRLAFTVDNNINEILIIPANDYTWEFLFNPENL